MHFSRSSTTQTLRSQLKHSKIELPEVSMPGGNYSSLIVRGTIAYIAIQFPIENGHFLFTGRLGSDVATHDGYLAARLCALNVLSQIDHYFLPHEIVGFNHFDMYFQSVEGWDEAPVVANGASDVLVAALGDKGKHTRAIIGAARLPRNFCVGITSSITLSKAP